MDAVITDNTAWPNVAGSNLERPVDALEFGKNGTRPKPDHFCLVRVRLQSTRGVPSGNVKGTAGQMIWNRLGIIKCAAVIELHVVSLHVRVDAVFFGHDCEVLGIGNETKRCENGPLRKAACDEAWPA